jgi:drug/metabolite transporter (DMT)-like permease
MKGYVYSLMSIILMSLAAPLFKLALISLDGPQVLFASSLSAAMAGFMYRCFQYRHPGTPVSISIKILSVIYAFAMVCFVFALELESPALVNLAGRSNLVFSFLLSFIFLRDNLTFSKFLGICFIVFGTFFMTFQLGTGGSLSLGLLLAIAYALLFSFHNAYLKIHSTVSTLDLLISQNLFLAITMSLPLVMGRNTFKFDLTAIFCAALAGLLSSFGGFILYRLGLHSLSLSEASAVRGLGPVLSLLTIYPFFSMTFSDQQIFSIMMIIIGCFIFNYRSFHAHKAQNRRVLRIL